MAKAAKSSNPHMKKMVSLARTLKGMHKADGGGAGSPSDEQRAQGIQKLKEAQKLTGNQSTYSAWQPSQARYISDQVRHGTGDTSFFRQDD